MVVDSKVSLTAYEQFINAEDENEKAVYLKEHVNSLKRHIEQLSEKKIIKTIFVKNKKINYLIK